jgi:hypothetical protein
MRIRTLQERLSTLKPNQRITDVETDNENFEELRVIQNLDDILKCEQPNKNFPIFLFYSQIKNFKH